MSSEKIPGARGGKNQRYCPALSGFISPAECGSQRGSKLHCPPHCPFFPFGTQAYDLWLKIDENCIRKTTRYLLQHLGTDQFKQLMKESRIGKDDSAEAMDGAVGHAIFYGLIFNRNSKGQTPAESWEAENWAGLNNDEQVMMRFRRHSFVTVVEIQKFLDHQAIQCLDLLSIESPPFVLFDRSIGKTAVRFSRILTWLTRYPHFSRPAGNPIEIPENLWPAWRKEIDLLFAEAKKQRPSLTVHQYLAEHFAECVNLMSNLGKDFRRAMLRNADLHQCVTTYGIAGTFQKVASILKSKPDFEPDEPESEPGFAIPLMFFRWLRVGESRELEKSMPKTFQHEKPEDGVGTMGNVRLYIDRLVIETFSKQKQVFAKEQIEKYLGALVKFEKESVVDMAKRLSEKMDKEAVPGNIPDDSHGHPLDGLKSVKEAEPGVFGRQESIPVGVQRQLAEQFFRRHYEKFLDDQVPALDGLTPREAAKDPLMRPRLIELMKGHLQQIERTNQLQNSCVNIDWLLDELGLSELK